MESVIVRTGFGSVALQKILERRQKWAITKAMKKIILSVLMIGFAVAVQAGDNKTCTKTACSETKTTQAACCSTSMTKASTCKGSAVRQTLMSPKGAEQTGKFLIASR